MVVMTASVLNGLKSATSVMVDYAMLKPHWKYTGYFVMRKTYACFNRMKFNAWYIGYFQILFVLIECNEN